MDKMKFAMLGFGLFIFCTAAVPDSEVSAHSKTPVFRIQNNLLLMNGRQQFGAGSFNGTMLTREGNIVLQKKDGQYLAAGMYTSPVIQCDSPAEVVISWNSDTPEGTSVSVEAQVLLNQQWTHWQSWGTWSTTADSRSVQSTGETVPAMDEDTLRFKTSQNVTVIRYRIKFETQNPALSPAIRLAAVTARGKAVNKQPVNQQKRQDVVLDVPQYSQVRRDPAIAGRICSPVSLSMVMNYYGIKVLPEEAAWGVMDYTADLFGNWPFNCAYSASFGLRAYVAFYDSLEDIRRDIMAGRPVVASVKYKKDEQITGDLPVLHNAPIDSTDGHLVVVRGFVHKNGEEFVVVNDPAAPNDEAVRVLYSAKEFEKAWIKVVYVILPDKKPLTQPKRLPAHIRYTGETSAAGAGISLSRGYLEAGGETIELMPAHVRSIVKTDALGNTEFLQPDGAGALWLDREAKNATVLVIVDRHRIYQASID